jgi:hypothetical protein
LDCAVCLDLVVYKPAQHGLAFSGLDLEIETLDVRVGEQRGFDFRCDNAVIDFRADAGGGRSVAADILLIAIGTGIVVDAIQDLGNM